MAMELTIRATTPAFFEIDYNDQEWLLAVNGGDWYVDAPNTDMNWIKIGSTGEMSWRHALYRALDVITEHDNKYGV